MPNALQKSLYLLIIFSIFSSFMGISSVNANIPERLGQAQIYEPLLAHLETGVTITHLTTGNHHSCALLSTGGVKCWGDNMYGQLGDGTTTDRLTPVYVSGLSNGVLAIDGGSNHTCALLVTGGVMCWGEGGNGQLGVGTGTDHHTPVDVSGLNSGVTQITAGVYYTCALLTTGGVQCWGTNSYGQLGEGTTTQRLSPVDVSGLTSGVSSISAMWDHTCALLSGSGMMCWGNNNNGQLGNGASGAGVKSTTPVDVDGLSSGVIAISAGAGHSCAVLSTGAAKCWGLNSVGSLGDGTIINRSTPVDVSGLSSGVMGVTAANGRSCAVLTTGGVKCWGSNTFGQLGDGTTTQSLIAVDVSGLDSGVIEMSAGQNHNCVLLNTGDVKCWGRNDNGQLGDGTTTAQYTPVDVIDLVGLGNISISHIEVTQATQEPDNTIPLLAEKTTYVRVYMECSELCDSITGVLHGETSTGNPLAGSPVNPLASASPTSESWQDQRTEARKTLNFIIPSAWIENAGIINLAVEANSVIFPEESITFETLTSIDVLYIPITYHQNSPNKDVIVNAYLSAEKLFPTSEIVYQEGSPITWDKCLELENPACPDIEKNRGELINELTSIYGGNQKRFVFGWLPVGTLGNGGQAAGIGLGEVAIGVSSEHANYIFAHELGHLLGRPHTNLENPADPCESQAVGPVNDWPSEYGNAKIQDWGMDSPLYRGDSSESLRLIDPDVTYDLMSYCGFANDWWISSFNYGKIYEHLNTSNPPIETFFPSGPKSVTQTYLVVNGLIFTDDTAELSPTWVRPAEPSFENPPVGTTYCLETQDTSSVVLSSSCFDLEFFDIESGGSTTVDRFTLKIPFLSGTAKVVLKKGVSELSMQDASSNPPSVTVISPNGGETWAASGDQIITWTGSDGDGDGLTYRVLYSPDGISWMPISLSTADTSLTVDSNDLAGGDSALIKVIATDGFNTSEDTSDAPFTVEAKPPSAYILSIENDAVLIAGNLFWLSGAVYDLEDGYLDEDTFSWSSDLVGELGPGNDMLISLPVGIHTITLSAADSDLVTAIAQVVVNVIESPTCYALTLDAVGSGTIVPTPSASLGCPAGEFSEGEIIELFAGANAGWIFDSWTNTDNDSETQSLNDLTMPASSHTVTASFTQEEYAVTASIVGNGSVTNTPGNPYLFGTTAALEPVADPGWGFSGWSGTDAADLSDNGDGTWDLSMDGNKAVTATFIEESGSILSADFETSDLSQWTRYNDGSGFLYACTKGAINGSYGACVERGSNDKRKQLIDDTPLTESSFNARFNFDINSLSMSTGERFRFLQFKMDAERPAFIVLKYDSGVYSIQLNTLLDDLTKVKTGWVTMPDGPTTIEVEWQQSTPGANDGYARLYLDDILQDQLIGLDNDTISITSFRMGFTSKLAGKSIAGTFYIDDVATSNAGKIGLP